MWLVVRVWDSKQGAGAGGRAGGRGGGGLEVGGGAGA